MPLGVCPLVFGSGREGVLLTSVWLELDDWGAGGVGDPIKEHCLMDVTDDDWELPVPGVNELAPGRKAIYSLSLCRAGVGRQQALMKQ